jgi:hypothetical protein
LQAKGRGGGKTLVAALGARMQTRNTQHPIHLTCSLMLGALARYGGELMRRVWAAVREVLFRLLGVLSKGSRALRRIRLVLPLSWIVFLLLAFGLLALVKQGAKVLSIYRAPLGTVQQLATATSVDSPYYRVAGLAYYDQGVEEYLTFEGETSSRRYLQRSYYLFLDENRQWGLMVMQAGALQRTVGAPLPPVRTVIAGRLVLIDSRLHGKLIEEGWGKPVGVQIALHWMLEEVPLRFPGLELFLLILEALVFGFLLLTRWFGYVISWPEPASVLEPAGPSPVGLRRKDMQVTAVYTVPGTGRKIRLVESLAALERDGAGWKVIAYDAGVYSPLPIGIPDHRIEQLVPIRIYFGWQRRWGLLISYRELDQGLTRRQLSLSFSDPGERQAAYGLLTGQPGPVSAA